jgi:hypothetical protein
MREKYMLIINALRKQQNCNDGLQRLKGLKLAPSRLNFCVSPEIIFRHLMLLLRQQ